MFYDLFLLSLSLVNRAINDIACSDNSTLLEQKIDIQNQLLMMKQQVIPSDTTLSTMRHV